GQFGSLLEQGVADNLARVEGTGAPPARRGEVEEVRRSASRAREVLARNLERAPAAARPGSERALQAAGRGPRAGRKGEARPGDGAAWGSPASRTRRGAPQQRSPEAGCRPGFKAVARPSRRGSARWCARRSRLACEGENWRTSSTGSRARAVRARGKARGRAR